MNFLRNLINKIEERLNPSEFTITEKVLPDFPSFKISNAEKWKILDNSTKLRMALKNKGNPSDLYKEGLFKCKERLTLKKDSECFPTYSDLTFIITIDKQAVANYGKECAC